MWELVLLLLALELPVLYACWVAWWASRAEPAPGSNGDSAQDVDRSPWRRPRGPRPRRGGPHGSPARAARRHRHVGV